MLDAAKISFWERTYFEEAKKVAPASVSDLAIRRWARSMALISEQHVKDEDDDLEDAT